MILLHIRNNFCHEISISVTANAKTFNDLGAVHMQFQELRKGKQLQPGVSKTGRVRLELKRKRRKWTNSCAKGVKVVIFNFVYRNKCKVVVGKTY